MLLHEKFLQFDWLREVVFQLHLKYRIYSINRPGRLLNFWTLRVGAYSRWALIRGWALIRINTVPTAAVLKAMNQKTLAGPGPWTLVKGRCERRDHVCTKLCTYMKVPSTICKDGGTRAF